MRKNFKHLDSGFTLVETLVAIGILVVVVAGAFSSAQSGLSSSIMSKNQVTAFYLAQEAIEQVRNIRDSNALAGMSWLSGIASSESDPCYVGNVCRVDVRNHPNLFRCPSGEGSCPVLKQDSNTGFYGYEVSWQDTIFRREVRIVPINSNEISVLVTVDWSKGPITRQFRIRENLLNWQ